MPFGLSVVVDPKKSYRDRSTPQPIMICLSGFIGKVLTIEILKCSCNIRILYSAESFELILLK